MMKQDSTFRLGNAVFDPGRGTLHRSGEMVMLRAKTFCLLDYLVRHVGRVIGKDELLGAVWPDTMVTEDSLTQCIRDARKAIGDGEKSIIRTMPRRGYMIELAALRAPPFRDEARGALAEPIPAAANFVVLPFQLDGTNESFGSIFDGVVAEVTAALAHGRASGAVSRYPAMNKALVALLKRIAMEKQASPVRIPLAWLLVQKPWIGPIPGSTRLPRLEENIAAAEIELTPGDLQAIESAVAAIPLEGERHPAQLMATVAAA